MAEVSSSSAEVSGKSAVVYLGRIPKEFEELEMRKFFSQFGTIKRLRLSRNKKTGASKHYAFLEFETPEVAEIVANTMNNYILFGHKLSCSVMDPNKIHETLWKGANKEYRVESGPRHFIKKVRTKEDVETLLRKRLERHQANIRKLMEMGIQYEYLAEVIQSEQKALNIAPSEVVEEKKESKEKKGIRIVKRLSKQTKKLGK